MAKAYGPVATIVYTITALSNNVGFNATTFTNKYNSTYGAILVEPKDITVVTMGGDVRVHFRDINDNLSFLFSYTPGAYNGEGVDWGFASEPIAGTFTYTSTASGYHSEEIEKLYGSVLLRYIDTLSGNIVAGGAGNVTSFSSNTFKNKIGADFGGSKTLDRIDVVWNAVKSGGDLIVHFTDSTSETLFTDGLGAAFSQYGITLVTPVGARVTGTDQIALTVTYAEAYKTKKIMKLYGPIPDGNGGFITKLIYEGANA